MSTDRHTAPRSEGPNTEKTIQEAFGLYDEVSRLCHEVDSSKAFDILREAKGVYAHAERLHNKLIKGALTPNAQAYYVACIQSAKAVLELRLVDAAALSAVHLSENLFHLDAEEREAIINVLVLVIDASIAGDHKLAVCGLEHAREAAKYFGGANA